MDINDILALTRAGFTKDDISALLAGNADSDNTQTAAPEAADTTEKPGDTAQAADPVPEDNDKGLLKAADPQAIMEELLGIKQAIIAGNVNNSRMPDVPPAETADDVIARILNPYSKKGE